jgi:Domain of unknown function (DUF4111)
VTLPEPVGAVCDTFLHAAPPGLVTGLYLRGGLGFGEWITGQSDVDFVATLSRRPTEDDLDALGGAHEQVAAMHPDVPFDGAHLLDKDLTADPEKCPDVPCILHRHFEREARYDISPVTWHELAWHGVTVAGQPHESIGIWTDKKRLLDFTRGNLDSYWRGNAEALTARPSDGAREVACCWCVLGVARLDHLLVTGELTTKSGAGRWGLTHYPEQFHRVLREGLRIREGGRNEYPDDDRSRGRDTAAFTAYVVKHSGQALRGRLRV